MWQSVKVAVALLVVVGLAMSGLAIAEAVEESGAEGSSTPPAVAVVLEALDPLVDDGTLTSEQADAVADLLAPHLVRARLQERGEEIGKHLRRVAAEIAEVLGIRPHELGEQLEAGTTLAEVAEANGWSGDELIVKVTDHIAAHLSVQVTAGKLDPERADERVGKLAETLADLIDVEHPFATYVEELRNRMVEEALGEQAP